MKTSDLHGLILYVSEGSLSVLLYIHNVGMGTLDFHGLISYVAEDIVEKQMVCHILRNETLFLHELNQCASEGNSYVVYCIHIEGTDVLYSPFLTFTTGCSAVIVEYIMEFISKCISNTNIKYLKESSHRLHVWCGVG